MTASSFDPTTGAPRFADVDTPDVAQNPTEAAEFAGRVGTRPIGTTAERVAYPYIREGLLWRDTTTGMTYEVDDSDNWVEVFGDTGWQTVALMNSWVNFGGAYQEWQFRRVNRMVVATGLVKSGNTTPGQTIAVLPAGFRPAGQIMKSVPISGGVGVIDVATDGRIIAGTVSATFTSLSFSFYAEQ